jgi:hypothetical protein
MPVPVATRSNAWVCGPSPPRISGSNLAGDMDKCCEFCVLSGRVLCDGLITHPEGSYRVWCVWAWSWNLDKEEANGPRWAAAPRQKKNPCRMLRGRLVGTATRYGLDGTGMESRWGRNIPQPFKTDPGAHTFSCIMGTASFSRRSNGRGVYFFTHPTSPRGYTNSRAVPLLSYWTIMACSSVSLKFPIRYSHCGNMVLW